MILRSRLNILHSILEVLDVKYTKYYADRLYDEHPYKGTLYGLSCMLNNYKISNSAICVEDKSVDIFSLPLPFVAVVNTEFLIINQVTEKAVNIINKTNVNISLKSFLRRWSGVALIISKNDQSQEKKYRHNRIYELFNKLVNILIFLFLIILCSLLLFYNQINKSISIILLLIINSIGAYITYLLLKKELNMHSEFIDKICGFYRNSSCNNSLKSTTNPLFNYFSLSELGFSYFISNICLILISPINILWLSFINLLTLPFSLWSIFYQKYIAKQWCILCVCVQIILWLIFFVCIYFYNLTFPKGSFNSVLFITCVYILPVLVIMKLINKIKDTFSITELKQSINFFKSSYKIFELLLLEQKSYKIDQNISPVLFGNTNAKVTITVITNLFCTPCAEVHKQISSLLKSSRESVCVQCVFISYDNMEKYTQYLIASYKQAESPLLAESVFTKWYNSSNKKDYFNEMINCNIDKTISNQLKKQKEWCEVNSITSTPMILFNGYKMPRNYNISDLENFIYINE